MATRCFCGFKTVLIQCSLWITLSNQDIVSPKGAFTGFSNESTQIILLSFRFQLICEILGRHLCDYFQWWISGRCYLWFDRPFKRGSLVVLKILHCPGSIISMHVGFSMRPSLSDTRLAAGGPSTSVLSLFTHPSNRRRVGTLLHSSAVCLHWLRPAGVLLCGETQSSTTHMRPPITEPSSQLELLCLWKTTQRGCDSTLGLAGVLSFTVWICEGTLHADGGVVVRSVTSLQTKALLVTKWWN